VKTREANFNRSVQPQKDLDFTGRTPLQIGQERHGNGHTAGNCGIMAVVAMWLAYNDCWVERDDMWLVTARNRQSLGPAELPAGGAGAPMQFEHSWAEIGTAADGGPFVIDPWAGVCCPKAQYAHDLTVQLNKWLQQGKQVRVNWGSLTKSYFYSIPANHPAILSLVAHNAVRDRVLGDEVIHARQAY
jgi:hypothetical protein